MDDLISRQALMKEFADFVRRSNNSDFAKTPTWNDAVSLVGSMTSAQPDVPDTNVGDMISRHAAINSLLELVEARRTWISTEDARKEISGIDASMCAIHDLPSAQPTINGYDIRHLELIAAVLQKENWPPERVTEALTDIGGIVAIITKEFEETLRKTVEQCMT